MQVKPTTAELAQQVKDADQEHQFAMASGSDTRLLRALRQCEAANAAYHKAKRAEFKKTYVYGGK